MDQLQRIFNDLGFSFQKPYSNEWVIKPLDSSILSLIFGRYGESLKWLLYISAITKSIILITNGQVTGYFVMAVVIFAMVKKPSKNYQIGNIYKSLHITPDGLFINTNKGKKFYHSNDIGDFEISCAVNKNDKIYNLTSNLTSTGEQLLIMRAQDSKKLNTQRALEQVASRMIDSWK